MRTIELGAAYLSTLPAGTPIILSPSQASKGKLLRPLNVTGKGESVYIRPPDGVDYIDMAGNRILAAGDFNHLSIDRVRGDFSGVRSDGIDLACNASSIAIQKALIIGIGGEQKDFHGDCIQLQLLPDGTVPKIDRLSITDCTLASGYQAILCGATTDGRGVREIFIDRVNIRDEPGQRKQDGSIAAYLGDPPTLKGRRLDGSCNIILGPEVYIDWPIAEKAMLWHPSSRVSGSFKIGRPPGGDFCK